jgi:hypothetical protein
MRRLYATFLLFATAALAFASDPAAGPAAPTGRVIKVLPLFVDHQNRDAVSPSLYDRDAYQFYLRQHADVIAGIRFEVLWKAANARNLKLKLRLELRGSGSGSQPAQTTLEQAVTPGSFRRWTALTLDDVDYKKFGKLVAWRATLWSEDRLLGEQKSFLW